MPAVDSVAAIVARFLKSNNYNNVGPSMSYTAFIEEAGLPEDIGEAYPNSITVERLLEEKRLFDKSINFEKVNNEDEVASGWSIPAPSQSLVISALPTAANVLNAKIDLFDGDAGASLVVSTADRRLTKITFTENDWKMAWSSTQNAPILSHSVIRGAQIVSSTMSGELVIFHAKNGQHIETRKDHAKYVVKTIIHDDPSVPLAASAGWDNKINIYGLQFAEHGTPSLQNAIASINLPTKPESITFAQHPDIDRPILIVSRADSSHLEFWTTDEKPRLLGKQNLAPHSNAWVAFTPTSIALCPSDASTIAIATNSTPHMKVIIAKLLWPFLNELPAAQTPLEDSRREQVVADREHNAIQLHCNSMSAQTPYSTPLIVWRPAGEGVWVNGDDGIIRGIDTVSGKIVKQLKGHVPGAKIRSLWAGYLSHADQPQQEVLVSGGFDHKLLLWTAEQD